VSTKGPKPEAGKWKVMDVIERLVEGGTDAHLYVRLTIAGKHYDLDLDDVEVTHMGTLPSYITFRGTPVKPDEPVKASGVAGNGLTSGDGKVV